MTRTSTVPFSVSSAGATTPTRYVGGTTTGAPTTGTFVVGDWAIAQNAHLWVCTVGGAPGTWVDAGSSGGADPNADHYQGAWSGNTPYVKNDLVTRSYALYIALAANTGNDPALTPTASYAAISGSSTTNNAFAGGSIGQKFVPAANGSVSTIAFQFSVAPGAGTVTVGIATAVGAAVTYVGGVSATLTTTAATSAGPVTVTLPSTVALTTPTQYFVVITGTSTVVDAVTVGGNATDASVGLTPVLSQAGPVSSQDMTYGTNFANTTTNFRTLFSLTTATNWAEIGRDQGAVQAAGVAQTARPAVNFVGSGVVVADDPSNNRTTVTVTSGATSVITVTSAYTAVNGNIVLANGTFTVTLPAPTANAQVVVKNNGLGVITIASGASIDGTSTAVLASQYTSLTVVSDGINWFVI